MCIILDANCYNKFLDEEDKDMHPIRTWLRSSNEDAKIAHSSTGKLESELKRYPKMLSELALLRRGDKIKTISSEELNNKKSALNEVKNEMKSDDLHIIALALAGNVKVLASLDKNLGDDFKKYCNGKIYKYRDHEHLLNNCKCK